MVKYRQPAVPEELAQFWEKLAEKEERPTKWSKVAIDQMWGYRAMHRARGNVE